MSFDDDRLLRQFKDELDASRQEFEEAKLLLDQSRVHASEQDEARLLNECIRRYNEAAQKYGDAIRRFAAAFHDLRLM